MCGQQSTQEPVSPRPGASRNAGKSAASLAEQGLVIQAGRGPLLRAAPSQGTHTGRQAGRPLAAAPRVGQDLPLASSPAPPCLADSASLERLPSAPPTPSVLTASSAGGSQFKFNHEKGRTDATGDIFLAIPGENRNLGPREEPCTREEGIHPLSWGGSLGSIGVLPRATPGPASVVLLRALMLCEPEASREFGVTLATATFHVGLASLWPLAKMN